MPKLTRYLGKRMEENRFLEKGFMEAWAIAFEANDLDSVKDTVNISLVSFRERLLQAIKEPGVYTLTLIATKT
jgi:hypothetical protein